MSGNLTKALLLQLPLQTHDFFFSHENIPLASAYLQVISYRHGFDAELLPAHLMRYGSEQAILKFIVNADPEIVGMSCYLWNLERSLFLGGEIKKHLTECKIILGGPEITPQNHFLLRHGDFDIGVVGEGELGWGRLLQSFPEASGIPGLLLPDNERGWRLSGGQADRTRLDCWPSPYLQGSLDPHVSDVLWLETVRGCVYKCAYCYYHKRSPALRTFPLGRVLKEIRRAREHGVGEIVFLDPCFIRRPNIEGLLDAIAAINSDHRLELHAEMTVEGIDPVLAKKMAQAGFVRIEAGLQSINPETLKRIHRHFSPKRFVEGVRSLQNCGIKVMVDLIAGLPGDTLCDICDGMDWIQEQEAYDYLMLYPLSLIPSTELKDRASEWGLSAMPFPPYLFTGGPGLTAEEMSQAFRYYEECMEEEISPLEIPVPLNPKSQAITRKRGLWNLVNWNETEQLLDFNQIEDQTTYALTITMKRKVMQQHDLWIPILKGYLKKNPFTLLSIEVPWDASPAELDPLWELARQQNHPAERDYTVTHSPYRNFLLFSRARSVVWKWPDPRESHPLRLHDGQRIGCRPVCLVLSPDGVIPRWLLEHVAKRYSRPPEMRLWQAPVD